MIRAVYRGLVWMHPSSFEERFGEELMWIFDLRRESETGTALVFDCFVSLGSAVASALGFVEVCNRRRGEPDPWSPSDFVLFGLRQVEISNVCERQWLERVKS